MTAQSSLLNEILRCRKWIEAALEYSRDTHDFKDIVDAILIGNMQLWSTANSCAVTEVLAFPKKKILHVFLAGGNMGEIRALTEPAVEWAKSIGCSDMTLTGRKGWTKALASDGWEDSHVMMIKRID